METTTSQAPLEISKLVGVDINRTPQAPLDLSKLEEVDNLPQELKDLVSSLPREVSHGLDHYNYQGFWYGPFQFEAIISCQEHFQAHDTDFFLATLPKAGTIWLKSLMFALINRGNYNEPESKQSHPLLKQNPHELVPFLELKLYVGKQIPDLDSFTPPRLFSTHMPFSVLPASVKNSSSKIIYLCRNPKDNFVSHWHFHSKMRPQSPISIEDAFDSFTKGVSGYGPFWDHVLGYWKESQEKPEKVLFLNYEEMRKQPHLYVSRLAEFLGCPMTKDEETSNVVEEILELCSFGNLSSLEVNKSPGWFCGLNNNIFFRRGDVGDWKNYLTEEMANKLDEICKQKFEGSGFSFY